MSEPKWEHRGGLSWFADGQFEAWHIHAPEHESVIVSLSPNEALSLASALLQYATQNGATND